MAALVSSPVQAGPPVQYERIDLVGQSVEGVLIERANYAMDAAGRLYVFAAPKWQSGESVSRGIYVRENDSWVVVKAPEKWQDLLDFGGWGARSIRVVGVDRVAAYAVGAGPEAKTIREFERTKAGWVETEILDLSGTTATIEWIDKCGGAYYWTERDYSGTPIEPKRLMRQGDTGPETLTTMAATLSQIPSYTNSGDGGFAGLIGPDHVMVISSWDYAMLWYTAWGWDESTANVVGGFTVDDMDYYYGGFDWASTAQGGLLSMNEVISLGGAGNSIRWQPVTGEGTPAFSVPVGDGHGFNRLTALSRDWEPAANDRGRVLFNAIRSDDRIGLFVGPDAFNDAIALQGDTLFGRTLKFVTCATAQSVSMKPHRISDRDHFVAELVFEDGSTQVAVATICPADVNRDDIIDNGDIGAWITLFLDGSLRADFNNDGVLDNGDIGEFITQFHDGC
ncbi:MAG: hypothetical protein ACI89L_000698 [Phycisphaerales bacterium]|jgi:hypothetical protein